MKMLLLSLMVLVGCAHKSQQSSNLYTVTINAAVPESRPELKKFVVLSGMEKITEKHPTFIQFAAYTANALSWAGYSQAANEKDADIIIYLTYDINGQVYTTTRNVPIYGNYAIKNNFGQQLGTLNQTSPSYQTRISSHVEYTKTIKLQAFNAKEMGQDDHSIEGMVWAVSMVTTDFDNDLHQVFPYMLTVGADYFNAEVSKKTIAIAKDSEHVNSVRTPASK